MIARRDVVKAGLFSLLLPWVGKSANITAALGPGDDLQAAVDALNGKGTLHLEAGDYTLPSTLCLNGQIELVGAGQNSTRLLYTGSGAGVQINSDGSAKTSSWGLRDLTVEGLDQGAVGVSIGQTGTGWKSAHEGGIQNCVIRGFVDAGLHLVQSQINRFWHVCIDNNPGHGIKIASPDGGGNTDTAFLGCYIRYNGQCGLYAESGSFITYRDCIFELNGEEAVKLHNPSGNDRTGSWMFDRVIIATNNYGRPRGPEQRWGQFLLTNPSGGLFGHVTIQDCQFNDAGGYADHVRLGNCIGEIARPIFAGPDNKLGRNIEDTINLHITVPGGFVWQLKDGNAHVTLKWESGLYPFLILGNDGAGQWIAL